MEAFTHLGRPIDLRYSSNRFAVAAAAVFAGAAFFLDAPFIQVGGAAFLAWALARELDPDRTLTANLAALTGGGAAILLDGASLGALYLLLVAARVLTRSTGLSPRSGDLAVHVVVGAFVARATVGWAAAMVLAAALALDATVPPAAKRPQLAWAGALAVIATVVAALTGWEFWSDGASWAWALAGLGLIGGVVALRHEPVRSTADFTKEPLMAARVRLSRSAILGGLLAVAALTAASGVASTAAAWLTLAVLGAVRVLPAGAGL